MPAPSTLLAFVMVVAVFAALPGPSNLYVVARGLRAGRRDALLGAAGCALGASVYAVATTLGLAALLSTSTTALSLLHYLGGAYLLVLAVRTLRTTADDHTVRDEPRRSSWGQVRSGLLVELANPKVALFFVAFFPQFVRPERGAAWSQILILGLLFCLIGLISDSLYAISSGSLHRRLAGSNRLLARGRRISGTLYLGLGAWSIWSGNHARGS